jgi:hypothetical protein
MELRMFFNSQLFNRAKSEVYQLLHFGLEDSDNKHTFGGAPRRKGAIPPDGTKRVHLFYELDLTDPLIEIRSPRPEITRLPLYYPLGNTGGMFTYRVVSNTAIKMLSKPYPKPKRDIPKPYPKPFPQESVMLQPLDYDPTDPGWLWNYGGVIGVGKLTAMEKTATKKALESWHLKTFDYPLIKRYDAWHGEEDDPDLDELVRMFTPFTQGMPEAICPNPECTGHKEKLSLAPLAYLETDENGYDEEEECQVETLLAGGDSGQLIWMVCPLCLSVVVDNPCT